MVPLTIPLVTDYTAQVMYENGVEYDASTVTQTWTLTSLTPHSKPVWRKWVFKVK